MNPDLRFYTVFATALVVGVVSLEILWDGAIAQSVPQMLESAVGMVVSAVLFALAYQKPKRRRPWD